MTSNPWRSVMGNVCVFVWIILSLLNTSSSLSHPISLSRFRLYQVQIRDSWCARGKTLVKLVTQSYSLLTVCFELPFFPFHRLRWKLEKSVCFKIRTGDLMIAWVGFTLHLILVQIGFWKTLFLSVFKWKATVLMMYRSILPESVIKIWRSSLTVRSSDSSEQTGNDMKPPVRLSSVPAFTSLGSLSV